MQSLRFTLALSLIAVAPLAVPGAASAQMVRSHDREVERQLADRPSEWRDQRYRWDGDRNGWDAQRSYRQGNYRERRLTRRDRIYRGNDNRYYCKRNDGTTGLVIGAIGGGVLGNVLGGKTLGTIIGAGAGGLLGREVDRGKVRCR